MEVDIELLGISGYRDGVHQRTYSQDLEARPIGDWRNFNHSSERFNDCMGWVEPCAGRNNNAPPRGDYSREEKQVFVDKPWARDNLAMATERISQRIEAVEAVHAVNTANPSMEDMMKEQDRRITELSKRKRRYRMLWVDSSRKQLHLTNVTTSCRSRYSKRNVN